MPSKTPTPTQIGYLRSMSPLSGRHLLAAGPRLAMFNKLVRDGLATKLQFGFRRSEEGERAIVAFDRQIRPTTRETLKRAVDGERVRVDDPGVRTLMQADLLWISMSGDIRVRDTAKELVSSWAADHQEGPAP